MFRVLLFSFIVVLGVYTKAHGCIAEAPPEPAYAQEASEAELEQARDSQADHPDYWFVLASQYTCFRTLPGRLFRNGFNHSVTPLHFGFAIRAPPALQQ